MARHSAFSPYRLMRWESGFGTPVGSGDAIAQSLYCGMKPVASWDHEQENGVPTGGVFNLEFSPEGSLLVAACEKKCIQIFDPLTHQRIHTVDGAHSDCVNCVKFLDGRMFATCSDDTTIALWDVRHLKKRIRSLLGHSNWVKNIEFSVKDKLLVTSGLDGSIYTWDINSYTEYNLVYQRVFHASGLMRCRLSPDARQMVMSTTGGLLVIVHDLNLSTLALDLHGFKPNLFRLMQMSKQLIPVAAIHDHLFDWRRKENRVEFVSDWPEGNEAEVVSALQIHPQGWNALSRNISHDDRSEWSCIHDIQKMDQPTDKSSRDTMAYARMTVPPPRRQRRHVYRRVRPPAPHVPHVPPAEPSVSSAPAAEGTSPADTASTSNDQSANEAQGAAGAADAASDPASAAALSSIQNDVWEASITIKQHRMLQELYTRGQVGRNFNMQRIMGINTGITPPIPMRSRALRTSGPMTLRMPPATSSTTTPSLSGQTPAASDFPNPDEIDYQSLIRQNRERLLCYVQETNEGKGFIKELCYSADGRLVCSPFGRGMRLLALNDRCSEISHCIQEISPPAHLVEVGRSLGYHHDLVVSARFSPRHHLLVTGCLEGKIVWYEPWSGETLY